MIPELISMGEDLSTASFNNLRTRGEYLPVSPSFLGAEFVEIIEELGSEDDYEEQKGGGSSMSTA